MVSNINRKKNCLCFVYRTCGGKTVRIPKWMCPIKGHQEIPGFIGRCCTGCGKPKD